MVHWLISFVGWLLNFVVGLLFVAFFVGLYVKFYERVKSIVMLFINIPRNAQVFVAEAKKRLAPDNKLPMSKTNRDE